MAKKKKSTRRKPDDTSFNDDGNIQDKRFQKAQTHPQFKKRKPKNRDDNEDVNENKSDDKVDDRFSAIHTDSRFSLSGDAGLSSSGVDKYGRVKKATTKKDEPIVGKQSSEPHVNDSDVDSHDSDKEDNKNHAAAMNEDPESRIAYLTALSRGDVETSSSSDESSSDSDDDGDNERENGSSDESSSASDDSVYGKSGILDPSYEGSSALNDGDQSQITFEQSPFVAICNMDWSHVRSVDLLAIVSSFSSPGSVKRVVVYPSDFGLERMKKDNLYGPGHIWKTKKSSQDKDDNDGDDVGVKDDTTLEQDSTQSEVDSEEDDEYDDSDIATEDITKHEQTLHQYQQPVESDFDSEKLRAYEASKLKYYFAVVEFKSSGAADAAYKELDGIEIGGSSATMDLRLIPLGDINDAVKDREPRDECTILPSKYNPPDFVVNALQQTTVRCTWEEGDVERDRLLTQYGVGREAWDAMAEGDDLRAYLASDNSSDTDSDAGSGTDEETKGNDKRKLLGLDVSDEDDIINKGTKDTDTDDDSFFGGDSDDSLPADKGNNVEDGAMQIKYMPGKSNLEDKIRSKLRNKEHDADKQDLTPWEKYQLKRKEKRKELKKSTRESKKESKKSSKQSDIYDKGNIHDESKPKIVERETEECNPEPSRTPSSKEELNLLLAGDNDEEDEKDYHMRSLLRREKNKDKKLYGSRKRKEDSRTADISGVDFQVDTTDERFSALLEGKDARFGIDKTDPRYKETPAMRKIMTEQTERRRAKKRIKPCAADENVNSMTTGGTNSLSAGATALSSLVRSLKAKVAKK